MCSVRTSAYTSASLFRLCFSYPTLTLLQCPRILLHLHDLHALGLVSSADFSAVQICLLLCVVWVKPRVCHNTRRQPLLRLTFPTNRVKKPGCYHVLLIKSWTGSPPACDRISSATLARR